MFPSNQAPESPKFSIHRSLLVARESPLPRPPGCSGSCPASCPESNPACHSAGNPVRSLENYPVRYSISHSAGYSDGNSTSYSECCGESNSEDSSSDCLENCRASNSESNPPSNRAGSLLSCSESNPADSVARCGENGDCTAPLVPTWAEPLLTQRSAGLSPFSHHPPLRSSVLLPAPDSLLSTTTHLTATAFCTAQDLRLVKTMETDATWPLHSWTSPLTDSITWPTGPGRDRG